MLILPPLAQIHRHSCLRRVSEAERNISAFYIMLLNFSFSIFYAKQGRVKPSNIWQPPTKVCLSSVKVTCLIIGYNLFHLCHFAKNGTTTTTTTTTKLPKSLIKCYLPDSSMCFRWVKWSNLYLLFLLSCTKKWQSRLEQVQMIQMRSHCQQIICWQP